MFRRTNARRYLALFLATSVLAATTACDDDDPAGPAQPGSVRAIHAIGNGPAVDLLVDGTALTGYSNVAFKANGAYQSVTAGARDFVVRQNGTTTALLTANDQAIASGTRYTIVALGRAGATGDLAPKFRLVPDAAAPAAGKAIIRVLHASPSAGNVDVYITAPNADLANEQPDVSGVAFNNGTLTTVSLDPGTYRIRLTTAGTKTVKIDKSDVTVAAGQRWLALGLGDDAPGTGNASAFELLLRQEN
jgi:hypothetical protein